MNLPTTIKVTTRELIFINYPISIQIILKLSPFVTKPTIVSGGLDGKIIVWDLNELKPIQLIENKANGVLSPSIYSLSNNHSNIISTGVPITQSIYLINVPIILLFVI